MTRREAAFALILDGGLSKRNFPPYCQLLQTQSSRRSAEWSRSPATSLTRDFDESLIRRLQSGDEVALGLLYNRYGRRMYSVARHFRQDSGAAEEVLQDIFYQLWRVAASFDSACGSLAGWLAGMARNRSIDRLRRRTPAIGGEVAAALHGASLDIESFTARSEMAGRVRAAVQALPEKQREGMELAYFEGLTQREISNCTGCPLGTVKTRLRTAIASLKTELRGCWDAPKFS